MQFANNDEHQDEKTFIINYSTEPVFNTTLSATEIQKLSFNKIYLSFKYYDSISNMFPCISYIIMPAGQTSERSYLKGRELSITDNDGNKTYNIEIDDYPFEDGEVSGFASYYIQYTDTDSLDKLPQTIQVPSE